MPVNCHPKNVRHSITAPVHSHEGVRVHDGWISLVLLAVWCSVGFVLFGPKHDGTCLHLNLVLVDGVQRAQCTTTCSAHGRHQRRVLSVRKGGWKGHHEIWQKADLRSRFFSTQHSLSKLWGLSGWALGSWSVKGRWQKYQHHKVVVVRNKTVGPKGTKHAIRHPRSQEKALPLVQAGASRKVGAVYQQPGNP